MEDIKSFLVPFLVRFLLKVGGGALLTLGVSEGSVTEIATAVVTLVLGFILSKFHYNKVLNTPPPAK